MRRSRLDLRRNIPRSDDRSLSPKKFSSFSKSLSQHTPVNIKIIVLRRDHSHDHSIRRLGFFREFLDDPCYPLASLNEHVDPLVLVRSMSIALGMITTNSHCGQP